MRSWTTPLSVITFLMLAAGTTGAAPPQYAYVNMADVSDSLEVDTEVDLGTGTCLNSLGQVVGTSSYWDSSTPPSVGITPVLGLRIPSRGPPRSGMTLLPTGTGSNGFWQAMGVNDAGTVVGQGP